MINVSTCDSRLSFLASRSRGRDFYKRAYWSSRSSWCQSTTCPLCCQPTWNAPSTSKTFPSFGGDKHANRWTKYPTCTGKLLVESLIYTVDLSTKLAFNCIKSCFNNRRYKSFVFCSYSRPALDAIREVAADQPLVCKIFKCLALHNRWARKSASVASRLM